MKFRAFKCGGFWYASNNDGQLWSYDLPSLMKMIQIYLESKAKPFPPQYR